MSKMLPLLIGLMIVSLAGAALAQGPPGDAAERREALRARHAELAAARNASLASFAENRTAALDAYHDAINATRASFLENKTRVLEECREARNESRADGNASAEAQCVREGLTPLIQQARAEHAEARKAFLERMLDARRAAIAAFVEARAHADARHGRPTDG